MRERYSQVLGEKIVVFLALLGAPLAAGQGTGHFFINLGDVEAWAGQGVVEVSVTLDLAYECDEVTCAGRGISAWSYAVCHDSAVLSLVGCDAPGTEPAAALAADTASLNGGDGPDILLIKCEETEEQKGVSVGLVATSVGDAVVPPQRAWRDLVLSYKLSETAFTCGGECRVDTVQALWICDQTFGGSDRPLNDVVVTNEKGEAEHFRGFSGGNLTVRCPACSEDFAVSVTDSATAPGGYAEVSVFLDFDHDTGGGADLPVHGWSYGICGDVSVAAPVAAVTDETDSAGVMLDFFRVRLPADFENEEPPCPNGGGVTVEAVVDLNQERTLKPVNDWRDLRIRYLVGEVDCTGDEVTTQLTPCDTVGCPPVNAQVLAEGGLSFPAIHREAGTIRILCDADLFVRGDTDGDTLVDLDDAIRILSFMFTHEHQIQVRDTADVTDDGVVGLVDVAYVLSYVFLEGPAPPWPHPVVGIDLTPDSLP